jgi:hypothetical protein
MKRLIVLVLVALALVGCTPTVDEVAPVEPSATELARARAYVEQLIEMDSSQRPAPYCGFRSIESVARLMRRQDG